MRRSAVGSMVTTAVAMALLATSGVAHGAGTAPVAREDRYLLPGGATLRVAADEGVLANDTSTDRPGLRAVLLVAPRHGTVALRVDGSFVYRPAPGYEGRDSFGYRAVDGNGASAMRAVKLTVNLGPRAVDDDLATPPGVRRTLPAPGVLANDVDTLGTPLVAVLLTRPTQGSVALSPRGAVDYLPRAGFAGVDSFTYRARDAYGAWSRPTTVTIRVETPNRAPVAVADDFTTTEDIVLEMAAPGLLANDTDPDGDPLVAEQVGRPSSGNVSIEPDGSFFVEPDINQDADITFRYRVGDGRSWSAVVEVLVDVIADNDPPVTEPDFYEGNAGERLTIPGPGVLANDGDPVEFDSPHAQLLTQPSGGEVAMTPDGGFTFDADPGPTRNESFTYLACDGGGCTQGEVTIGVFGDDIG